MPVWRTVRARGEKGCVYYLPERKNHFCQIPNSCSIRDSRFAMKRTTGFSYGTCHLQSKEEAQNAPTPVTTYALFYDGAYLTNEQMNDRKFLKLLSK